MIDKTIINLQAISKEFWKTSLFSIPVLILFIAIFSSNNIRSAEGDTGPLPEFDCVIEPSAIVDLGSAVPGVIGAVHVERSDSVKKGDVVAELESSVAKASVKLSKERAGLDTSIELRKESAAFGLRTKKRNQALVQRSSISKQAIDKLETENRIADLQVHQEQDNKNIAGLEYRRAQAILERHSIRTPFDGVVMDRFKSVGEYIEADPVLRVARLDPLNVEVILPVKYMGRLTSGLRAEVTPVLPGYVGKIATVTLVDKVADAASGTFGTRLSLPNPGNEIPSGLRCKLAFLPPEKLLPQQEQEQEQAQLAIQVDEKLVTADDSLESENDGFRSPGLLAVASGTKAGTHSNECYSVGPLANEELASKLLNAMTDMAFKSEPSVDLVNSKVATEYLVLATNQPDGQTASDFEAYLKNKGVHDINRLRGGLHKGRISVGYYHSQENALRRQSSMHSMGIEVEVLEINRQLSAYWINLLFDSSPEFNGELRTLANTFAPSAGVQRALCETQLTAQSQ